MENISLGYIGQRRSVLGRQYLLGNGYRGFNPVLKRFSSWDRSSPFGVGGCNGYLYCSGNPVNMADTSGHAPLWKIVLMDVVTHVEVIDEVLETEVVDSVVFSKEHTSFSKKTRLETGYIRDIDNSGQSVLMIHGNNSAVSGFMMLVDATNEEGLRTTIQFMYKHFVQFLQMEGIDLSMPEGTPLHLLMCGSGRSDLARELAKYLKRPVISYGNRQRITMKSPLIKDMHLMPDGFFDVRGSSDNRAEATKHYPDGHEVITRFANEEPLFALGFPYVFP